MLRASPVLTSSRLQRYLAGGAILSLALSALVACASDQPAVSTSTPLAGVTSALEADPTQSASSATPTAAARAVTRTSGASVVQSSPVSGSVILRTCSQLPNVGVPPQECSPADILPDGSSVQMRCWKDTIAPTRQDPSYTSPRWFFATEIDHNPGWSGWIYSAQIPVSEQIITPRCTDELLNRYPIGNPTPPPPLPSLQFAVEGVCTTAGGTLTATSANFTPGDPFEVAASYSDGSAYPLDRTSGTAAADGSVPWSWSCAGDPPGHYTTYLTDMSTGRQVTADFAILPEPSLPPSAPAPQPPPPTHSVPVPHAVKAYDNYGPANAGHAMCRGNPNNGASMPGGTVIQSFRVPPGVRSLTSALIQIDPDASVTAHLTVLVDGHTVASTQAAAGGDTTFDFGAVSVSAGQTVTLSIYFTATYGKIITVYTAGNPGGTFSAANSCSDGAPSPTTSGTGLRAIVDGMS